MNTTVRCLAGGLMLAAVLLAGCGGERAVATDAESAVAAHAAASQDRLPPLASSPADTAAADDTVEALTRDACEHWIATTCVQASLRSEAICRLARCEQVSGVWTVNIPHEQVDAEMRRLGY